MLSVKDSGNLRLSLGLGWGGAPVTLAGRSMTHLGAVMGQYCQSGLEFMLCFSLTEEVGIMHYN